MECLWGELSLDWFTFGFDPRSFGDCGGLAGEEKRHVKPLCEKQVRGGFFLVLQ